MAKTVVGTWEASDGSQLAWKKWLPDGPPRAQVIASHGMSCWVDDFDPLGEVFAEHGIALAAWNLRGQGCDPNVSRRGAWLDVTGWLGDLSGFAKFVDAGDLPLFLCGESMGALLSLQAASRDPWKTRISGLLLFVPVAKLAQKNPPWMKSFLRWMSDTFPALRLNASWFVHGRPTTPQLTRIPERQHYVETSPHQLGPVTLGYLASMGELIEASIPAAEALELPVALFSAGHDAFITASQTREFFGRIHSADKTLFEYPDGYHQLMFDLDATKVVNDAARWIESQLER